METTNIKVAEVQLTYKSKVKAAERFKINSSEDAYRLLQSHWSYELIEFLEEFKIILLNRANQVLGLVPISMGGTTGTVVDPKVVFVTALKMNAQQIILVHNHPSGNLKPSESDRQLTRKMIEAGRYLDLQVIDHIILSVDGYTSFTDEGLM